MLLATSGGRKPTQANLCRATSTTYYAMFHCLAKNCADLLIGGPGSNKSKHAWVEVYRSLLHGTAKSACEHNATISKFPAQIEDFANKFVEMQNKRHEADYNPYAKFHRSEVVADIRSASLSMQAFSTAPVKDRRAFASWVLFKTFKKRS